MAQLNLNLTDDFEANLERLMKKRHISRKSDAIRLAVREAAERDVKVEKPFDFRSLAGQAKKRPLNRKPKFKSDDDVWS